MASRHVLAVLDGPRQRVVDADLSAEPDGFGDLARLADLAAADGAPSGTPAGPALTADGLVVHRVRAEVADEPALAETAPRTADLEALLAVALDEETGCRPLPAERAPWCRAGWAAETRAWVDGVLAAWRCAGRHRARRRPESRGAGARGRHRGAPPAGLRRPGDGAAVAGSPRADAGREAGGVPAGGRRRHRARPARRRRPHPAAGSLPWVVEQTAELEVCALPDVAGPDLGSPWVQGYLEPW